MGLLDIIMCSITHDETIADRSFMDKNGNEIPCKTAKEVINGIKEAQNV